MKKNNKLSPKISFNFNVDFDLNIDNAMFNFIVNDFNLKENTVIVYKPLKHKSNNELW